MIDATPEGQMEAGATANVPAATTSHAPAAPHAGKLTSTGGRKASAKSARSRSRELALQALYQHLVGRNDATAIDLFTRDLAGFHKADSVHYDALLHGCIAGADQLDALIVRCWTASWPKSRRSSAR